MANKNSMKRQEAASYAITAYKINLKEREKYYGDYTKENSLDKKAYLSDVKLFVKEFLSHLTNVENESNNSYLHIYKSEIVPGEDFFGIQLFVNYGKSGQEFMTVEQNGERNEFDRTTKIVKYYRLFFFVTADNAFMVIFRDGLNSCKTAIFNEMRSFLDGTNVLVDLPYVSNNKYIESLMDDVELISLNYDTLYKSESNDNADDPKYGKQRYSSTNIDLTLGRNKNRFGSAIIAWLKHEKSKSLIAETLSTEIKGGGEYYLDDENMSVVVTFNGYRRTMKVREFVSFFDVDITSKLDIVDNKPTDESIKREVVNYISGIDLPELNNE